MYQKQRVHATSTSCAASSLPLYIALPWKDTAQHDELLEIVVRQQPEFGRAHYPAKVRAVERARRWLTSRHGQPASGPRG